jgi:hypothetical protein
MEPFIVASEKPKSNIYYGASAERIVQRKPLLGNGSVNKNADKQRLSSRHVMAAKDTQQKMCWSVVSPRYPNRAHLPLPVYREVT